MPRRGATLTAAVRSVSLSFAKAYLVAQNMPGGSPGTAALRGDGHRDPREEIFLPGQGDAGLIELAERNFNTNASNRQDTLDRGRRTKLPGRGIGCGDYVVRQARRRSCILFRSR